MICAGRLDMRVVLIKAEVDEAGLGFVIPFALAVPEFACARLERHAVECHAKPAAASVARSGVGLRFERDPEIVALRGDAVGIAGIWKIARLVIGQTIRAEHAMATFDANDDFVLCGRRGCIGGSVSVQRSVKQRRSFVVAGMRVANSQARGETSHREKGQFHFHIANIQRRTLIQREGIMGVVS